MGFYVVGTSAKANNKLRGAICTRYSDPKQHSTADQIRTCQDWADANGVDVEPQHIFVDEGVTGKRRGRPALDRMKEALANDEFGNDVLGSS